MSEDNLFENVLRGEQVVIGAHGGPEAEERLTRPKRLSRSATAASKTNSESKNNNNNNLNLSKPPKSASSHSIAGSSLLTRFRSRRSSAKPTIGSTASATKLSAGDKLAKKLDLHKTKKSTATADKTVRMSDDVNDQQELATSCQGNEQNQKRQTTILKQADRSSKFEMKPRECRDELVKLDREASANDEGGDDDDVDGSATGSTSGGRRLLMVRPDEAGQRQQQIPSSCVEEPSKACEVAAKR